jgi:hypothetical protein
MAGGRGAIGRRGGESSSAPAVPTARDIAAMPQRPEKWITVPGWSLADGTPFRVKIRALSFRQRRAANQAAYREGIARGIEFCEDTWAVEVVLAGLVEPAIDRGQVDLLLDSHAGVIDALATAIEEHSRVDGRALEVQIARMAGVTVKEPETAKTRRRKPRSDGAVDPSAGQPSGSADRGAGPAV